MHEQATPRIVNLQEAADILGYNKTHLSRIWPGWRKYKDGNGRRILRVLKARPNAQPRFYMNDILKIAEVIGTQNAA